MDLKTFGKNLKKIPKSIRNIWQKEIKRNMRTYDILNAGINNRFMCNGKIISNSGQIVQPQNLAKPNKEVQKKYDLALKLLRAGDYEGIKKNFSQPIEVATAAIRPIFRASKGNKFLIADLSAIESRGSGWVADCEPLMQIFREGKDPYIFFAVYMDGHKTYEELYAEYKSGNKVARTFAKAPFLGCCYSLGPGEIKEDEDGNKVKTGLLGYAQNMGIDLPVEYAERAVNVYRNLFKEVTQFWYALHNAFIHTLETDEISEIGPLRIEKIGRVICIWLPSGKALHYINPEVVWEDAISRAGRPYKRSKILVDGIDQKTHQWTRIETRGSKIFENVIQGFCRDLLCYGMMEARNRGMDIVLHVHDEIVVETPESGNFTVKDLVDCMTVVPSWAPGFLTGAEGFESEYYTKE